MPCTRTLQRRPAAAPAGQLQSTHSTLTAAPCSGTLQRYQHARFKTHIPNSSHTWSKNSNSFAIWGKTCIGSPRNKPLCLGEAAESLHQERKLCLCWPWSLADRIILTILAMSFLPLIPLPASVDNLWRPTWNEMTPTPRLSKPRQKSASSGREFLKFRPELGSHFFVEDQRIHLNLFVVADSLHVFPTISRIWQLRSKWAAHGLHIWKGNHEKGKSDSIHSCSRNNFYSPKMCTQKLPIITRPHND